MKNSIRDTGFLDVDGFKLFEDLERGGLFCYSSGRRDYLFLQEIAENSPDYPEINPGPT